MEFQGDKVSNRTILEEVQEQFRYSEVTISIALLLTIFQILFKLWAGVWCQGCWDIWINATIVCKTRAKTYLSPGLQNIPGRGTCGLTCPASSPSSPLFFYCVDTIQPSPVILNFCWEGGYRTVIICSALHEGSSSHGEFKESVWSEAKMGSLCW